ncbi:MAG: type II secretion system F family protein [Nitriliruptoraceae bacterium]
MTVVVGAAAVVAAVPLFVWALVSGRPQAHADVVGNLRRGLGAEASPTISHSAAPGSLGSALRRVHPDAMIDRIDRLQSLAGRSADVSLDRVLATKAVLFLAAMLLGVPYALADPTPLRVAATVIVMLVTFFVPELLLYSRGQERQKIIQNELADTLDQMTIAVEAGLGFDAAMVRAANAGTGPLAEELVRTLQEIQVGVPRRDAFRGLAARTTVTDLQRFVSALLQADTYGIPLVDILRTQAEEIRRKRRHRAEQRAMQIPVKVVFPLVLCILPTLFIVLLGPAALDIVGAF